MIKIYRNFQNYSVEPFIVAAIWQQCVIKDQTGNFSLIYGSVLGISVWLAYSIDRFFEPRYEKSYSSERHQVLRKRKKVFLVMWFTFVLLILYLVILHLSVSILIFGVVLVLCVLVNQYLSILETRFYETNFFSKEFRTTILFSCGILFFPAVAIGMQIEDMFLIVILLTNSIFLNCSMTNFFERNLDMKRNNLSFLQASKPRLKKSILLMILVFLTILPHVLVETDYNLTICAYIFTIVSLALILFINSSFDTKRRITDTVFWLAPLISLIFLSET